MGSTGSVVTGAEVVVVDTSPEEVVLSWGGGVVVGVELPRVVGGVQPGSSITHGGLGQPVSTAGSQGSGRFVVVVVWQGWVVVVVPPGALQTGTVVGGAGSTG